ncbi:MAG: right-handed parallel beta-helix repeat-containing protein, partial [Planctomycetales bacterium]|nr:right-handed parallel beta-helix repeat-containing protein [Planctomycetales bacterium]
APTIDQGDPSFAVGGEPSPNGGRINLGVYGGTAEATRSASEELVQLLSPNGFDRYSAGDTIAITWRSTFESPVDLFLYDAATYQPGTSTPVLQIADDVIADGVFDWTIPGDGSVIPDNRYLIGVQAVSGNQPSDISNHPFMIANGGNAYYLNDASLNGDVYTSVIGDDSNIGKSPDQPMATLNALIRNHNLTPGDVIYVDTGIYPLTYTVVLGGEQSGIRIQGPGDPTHAAVFDGQGSGTGFHFDGADDVTLANLSITGFANGIYAYNSYVPSPDSERVRIINNQIYGNTEKGIYLRHSGAIDWSIEGNRIYDNSISGAYGINVFEAEVEIRNNVVFGNSYGIFGNLTGVLIEQNSVFNNVNGIGVYNNASAQNNLVYDNTTGIIGYSERTGLTSIHSNEVFGNVVGIDVSTDNVYGTTPQIAARDNRVFDNQIGVRGNKSNRYQARFTGKIYENYIYSNSVGIELSNTSQAASVYDNLIYANTNLGLKLVAGDLASIVNNTIVQNVGDVVRIEGATDHLIVKNNILLTESGNVLNVASDSFVGHAFDYNLLQQGTDPNAHIGLWGTTVLDSLSEWQTTTGLDANSLTGDPGFLDIDGADNILGYIADGAGYDGGLDDNFVLTANSIAIDRGDTASAPLFDILGNARVDDPGIINGGADGGFVDLGAYEFQGNSNDSTPPVIIAATPEPVHSGGSIAGTLDQIVLILSEAINEIDANAPAAYSLLFSGPDGVFGNLDDSLVELWPSYEAGATTIALSTTEPLQFGSYRLTLFGSTTLHDASGLRLDGDGDGTAGGDYVREFSLEADFPPTASDVVMTIDEDVETLINLVGDDGNPDVDQDLIFEITSLPEHGTLSRTAGGTTVTAEQLPLRLTSSQIFFKSAANTHQSSQFTFQTRDDGGQGVDPNHLSNPATVSIAIAPVNDSPVVQDASVELGELSHFGITVATISADDPDLMDVAGDTLTYAIVDGNQDGIFQITQTGRVVLVAPEKLDYEVQSTHQLTVQVTDLAGASDTGTLTVTLLDEAEAQVEEVVINGDASYRSQIDQLTVRFNRLVEIDFAIGGPFRLVHLASGDAVDLLIQMSIVENKTVADIRFRTGTHVDSNGNLADGRYELSVLQSRVSAEGFPLDGNRDGTVGDDFVFGADQADQFFRLFGDSDGDGDVDAQDYGQFGLSFLKSEGDANYNPAFDYDQDGDVDGQDYGRFEANFLKHF